MKKEIKKNKYKKEKLDKIYSYYKNKINKLRDKQNQILSNFIERKEQKKINKIKEEIKQNNS